MSEGEQNFTLPEGHFGHEIQHEAFQTPEGKQFLGKYQSMEDALVGGFNASKMVGKKLENVIQKPAKDAKPEDVQTFQASLLKELGAVDDEKALDDLNLVDGLPDGSKADEKLAAAFKKFVVSEKVPKSLAAKLVKFNNAMAVQFEHAQQQAQLDRMKTTNEALMKDWGGKKGVAEATELVKRMFSKHVPADKFEAVGQELAESGITRSPLLADALMKMAQAYKEDATEGGGGDKPQGNPISQSERLKKELPNTTKALGWK